MLFILLTMSHNVDYLHSFILTIFLFDHKGIECLESQFRCLDDSGCIDEELLCDEFSDCQDHSDEENCLLRDQRLSDTLLDYYPTLDGNSGGGVLVSVWLLCIHALDYAVDSVIFIFIVVLCTFSPLHV